MLNIIKNLNIDDLNKVLDNTDLTNTSIVIVKNDNKKI